MEHEKQTYEFKTEVKQFMNLIINSLYSNKEIFLRELISNASDAIDRLGFKAQTNPDIVGDNGEYKIKITPDKNNRTLIISDNGIGMTYDEVVENIGTIAKSGTAAFMAAVEKSKTQETLAPELIGQFGVGFYSAYIVADKVTLITRAAGASEAVKWESTGDGTYTIEPTTKASHGTEVILNLKAPETDEQDFTDEWTIRHIVKKHSDFVNYPIVMDVEREITEKDDATGQLLDADGKPVKQKKTEIREETLNSMKAIWAKDKKEVTDEEYNNFYTHISHDWNPPLTHIHFRLEGVTEYSALLFIPSKAPFDLFYPTRRHGIHLYCRRVFIMDDCKELIPEYLRFIKGVVDAPDLNLNISREILQQDALVRNIQKNLVKKILDALDQMDSETYAKFYDEFGAVLKEGMHTDWQNREKILPLIRYQTTRSDGKKISLKDYVANMPPDQEEIYYITGENISVMINSPHLEVLKEKGYEVLLMTDPVDEFVIQSLPEYEGKKFKSAEKGNLDIAGVDKEKSETYSALFDKIKSYLEEKVKDVRPSSHLKDSVSCMSGDAGDMSAYMAKLLKSAGQDIPEAKRILELNINHPLLEKMQHVFESDSNDPSLKDYSVLLLDLAIVGEGGKVDNPSRFIKMVGDLTARAIS
ncbi:MAG: molecular chaperone HtpG [Desulfobacteraceae bacterium]|jgi:molecular chaperone HtpG|nr:MAG: molecular chaperone HtpG [Desulfobacteraceae bacterium]